MTRTKKQLLALATLISLVALLAVSATIIAENNSAMHQEVARARNATAKYHDVNQALADGLAQVPMGRGDDADIVLDRRAAADRGELAFLQHAQQAGLRLGRHVADLVQE